jgi:hypothetical protein
MSTPFFFLHLHHLHAHGLLALLPRSHTQRMDDELTKAGRDSDPESLTEEGAETR